MTSVYLAGKISKNDWRPDNRISDGDLQSRSGWNYPTPWRPQEWNGLTITGPFFVGCDHGCTHGNRTHANSGGCVERYYQHARTDVYANCLEAIQAADIFFAWLDTDTTAWMQTGTDAPQSHDVDVFCTAYGTLVELGYARGLDKTIVIGTSERPGWDTNFHNFPSLTDELWFAFRCASDVIVAPSAREALEIFAEKFRPQPKLESPLEEAFWREHKRLQLPQLKGLVAQHPVTTGGDRFRLDFALPEQKIAFEMDGYTYHSDRTAWARDRRRDLKLSAAGWRVHRFDGDHIRSDTTGAVQLAAHLASDAA